PEPLPPPLPDHHPEPPPHRADPLRLVRRAGVRRARDALRALLRRPRPFPLAWDVRSRRRPPRRAGRQRVPRLRARDPEVAEHADRRDRAPPARRPGEPGGDRPGDGGPALGSREPLEEPSRRRRRVPRPGDERPRSEAGRWLLPASAPGYTPPAFGGGAPRGPEGAPSFDPEDRITPTPAARPAGPACEGPR